MGQTLEELEQVVQAIAPGAEPDFSLTMRAFRSPPGRLAILDSSFNPPTAAHQRMIEAASESVGFDHHLLLLAKANVDKPIFGARFAHRLQMMELLARDIGNTSVGIIAYARFVDKARALKRFFGPDTRLTLLLGSDTLVRLFDPKYYDDLPTALCDLFGLASVVCLRRAGPFAVIDKSLTASDAVRPFLDRLVILPFDEPYASMSSTDARRALARGADPQGTLLPAIVDYAHDHSLYRR